jgi:ABC-2 type transport system permease protein
MTRFLTLLRLQMLGVFGINKMLKSKQDNTARLVLLLLAGLGVASLIAASSYNMALITAVFGANDVLPSMTLMFTAVAALIFTYFRAKGVLFGHKDYDHTMSLPVSAASIVLSRITMLYLGVLAFSMLIYIPAMIAYGASAQGSAHGLIMLGLTMFLAPLIPMTISILLGTLIVALTSRFRHANIIAIFLAFALLGAYFYFIFSVQIDMMATVPEDIGVFDPLQDLGMLVTGALANFYPPAGWLSNAMTYANWGYFGLFAAISLVPFVAYIFITSKFYVKINTRLAAKRKRSNYRLDERELKAQTPFMALYKRELRRITTSVTYAMNVCIGPLLLLTVAVALAIVGPETLEGFFDPGLELGDITGVVAPFIFLLPIFIGNIYPASSVNLSLEGRNNWIMCSIPVSAKTIFKSKIAMSLTLTLPAAIISSVIFIIVLRPDPITAALLLVTPAAYAALNSFFGMFINAKFPRYDWENEYRLLKGTGSASVLITSIGGLILTIFIIILSVIFAPIITIITAIILIASIVGIIILNALLSKEKLFAD